MVLNYILISIPVAILVYFPASKLVRFLCEYDWKRKLYVEDFLELAITFFFLLMLIFIGVAIVLLSMFLIDVQFSTELFIILLLFMFSVVLIDLVIEEVFK